MWEDHLSPPNVLTPLSGTRQYHEYIFWLSRPTIRDDVACIQIEQGRHPVIDSLLGEGEQYVPNDTNLQVSLLVYLIMVLFAYV